MANLEGFLAETSPQTFGGVRLPETVRPDGDSLIQLGVQALRAGGAGGRFVSWKTHPRQLQSSRRTLRLLRLHEIVPNDCLHPGGTAQVRAIISFGDFPTLSGRSSMLITTPHLLLPTAIVRRILATRGTTA